MITIIVLLILAGVSVSVITGYDSIPDNAKIAVDTARQDTTVEQTMVNSINNLFEKYLPGGIKPPPTGGLTPLTGTAEVDESGLATKKTLIKPDADRNEQIVIPEGWAPAILTGSTSTTSSPGQNGSVASIMAADQWKNITVEQINKGIVIVDHAITYDNGQSTGTVPDFNEFVWVPIPNSDDFDRIAWMETYKVYEGSGWNQFHYETKEQAITETSTTDSFWEDATNTEYANMVSSVNQHKGFYIGRYECSIEATIAQSKRGQEPAWQISRQDSLMACSRNTAISNIHLMYGIEWDSTLNWLKDNATIAAETTGTTKTMGIEDIQTNSNTWGNYTDSTGSAASAPYEYDKLQNTGASEYWKANNIYDLAGNILEQTQENYSTGNDYALRGGAFVYEGTEGTAAFRERSNRAGDGSYFFGFRVSFYL